MTKDGVELAALLLKSLQKDKIILVGHSWGSLLGVLMVKARPDLFYAFVGTGQVGDSTKNYAVAYDELLEKATALGEATATRELGRSDRRRTPDGRGLRRPAQVVEPVRRRGRVHRLDGRLRAGGAGLHARDFNDWCDGQILSGERLVPQTSALDAKALSGDFAIPVFVIQGAEDFTTPTSLARSFVDTIRAPAKAFIPIEGGGHFAVFMKTQAFLDALVPRVVPLARSSRPK